MPSNRTTPPRVVLAACAAIGLTVIASGVDRPSAALENAIGCPGAIEYLIGFASSRADETPVAALAAAWNAIAVAVAAAAFAGLAWRSSGRWTIAAAAVAAMAVTPAMARELRPGDAATFALACLLLLVVAPAGLRSSPPDSRPRRPLAAFGHWPVWLLAAVLAASVLPVPSGAACSPLPLLLRDASAWPTAASAAIGAALHGTNPLVFVLALLAVVASVNGSVVRTARPAWLLVAASLLLAGIDSPPARVLALPLAALYALAAAGASVLLDRARTTGGRLAAISLVIAWPVLQHARLGPPQAGFPALDADVGHRAMTHRAITAIAGAMPPGAILVDEDALTQVLLLGVSNTKGIERLPAHATIVATRIARGDEVFALPRGTALLERQGFRLSPTGRTGAPGLAKVAGDAGCVRPTGTWQPWTVPAGAAGFALVAESEAARGPIVLYLVAEAWPVVTPRDNAPAAARGLFVWDYDLSADADRARLQSDARDDRLDATVPLDAGRFVKRIEFWRVQGVGPILAIDVAGAVSRSAYRLPDTATGPAPLLCPTFRHEIESMVPPRTP